MRLSRLRLLDLRNYVDLTIDFAAGLNIFVGQNAQGKSNLLEAVGMLAMGKSFRTSREGELVRHGATRALVSGDAVVAAGTVQLACEIAASPGGVRKTYRVNGEARKFARYLGSVRAVIFSPRDIELVDGPPTARRAMLNSALSQSDPRYYRQLALYSKALAQKRALLQGQSTDRELLAAYNEQLAASGEALLAARSAYVEMLGSAAAQAYARLELAGSLRVEYRPNVEGGRLRERLEESLGQELARRTPLVGPHRDELALLLDGSSLAAFGSQGQKRGAGLALRLAEYAALSRQTGEAPLLLLDDVLSELDEQRGRRLLDAVAPLEQTFLTTTAAQAGSALHSRLYRIENGYVERVGC